MDDGKELLCERRLFSFPVRKPGQNQKLPGCNAVVIEFFVVFFFFYFYDDYGV